MASNGTHRINSKRPARDVIWLQAFWVNKEKPSCKGSNLRDKSYAVRMKLKSQKLRLFANCRQTEIDRTEGANQKTFTRSHEAADIHTDTVTHSSHLNMSYYGFRQVQQTVHITSSIKITLTMTTDIKNQLFTRKNPLLRRHYLQLKDCANILNFHYYTTQTVFQGVAKQKRWKWNLVLLNSKTPL